MTRQLIRGILLAWAAIACAAAPHLHARIAGKQGPVDARQWTFEISGDPQSPVSGVAIESVRFIAASGGRRQGAGDGGSCHPVVKSPTAFPLAVGTVPAGGTAAATVSFDFTGCPNQTHFTVDVKLTGNGGATGMMQRNNEYR